MAGITLSPRLDLYDPTGALVLSVDQSSLEYTTLLPGTYTIAVRGQWETTGSYALTVAGATGPAAPFAVQQIATADGIVLGPDQCLNAYPSGIVLTFPNTLDLTSVSAAAPHARRRCRGQCHRHRRPNSALRLPQGYRPRTAPT